MNQHDPQHELRMQEIQFEQQNRKLRDMQQEDVFKDVQNLVPPPGYQGQNQQQIVDDIQRAHEKRIQAPNIEALVQKN